MLIALPFFLITSCSESHRSGGNFYATDMSSSNPANYTIYPVTAKLLYNGTYCKVYKDISDRYMSDDSAISMGVEFDNNIADNFLAEIRKKSRGGYGDNSARITNCWCQAAPVNNNC